MKVKCIDNGVYKNELTIGKVYEAISFNERTYKVIDNSGVDHSFFKYRFEEVTLSMEELKEASKLIGKDVSVNGGSPFKVKSISVYFKDIPNNGSFLDSEELRTNDFCVSIVGMNTSCPYKIVKVVNPSKTLKLNDGYTATVYKDKIEVGCQTFPISILQELQELHKSLYQNLSRIIV